MEALSDPWNISQENLFFELSEIFTLLWDKKLVYSWFNNQVLLYLRRLSCDSEADASNSRESLQDTYSCLMFKSIVDDS